MRKVKVTKNFLKKGLLVFGMSKSQLAMVIIGAVLAIATVSCCIFLLHWDFNVAVSLAFVEIVVFAGAGVYKINGMSLFKYLFILFLCADDVRAFSNCKKEVRESEKE